MTDEAGFDGLLDGANRPSVRAVSLDVLASQYEFPLVVNLHLPTGAASDLHKAINAETPGRLQLLGFKTFQRVVLSPRLRGGDRASRDISRIKSAHLTVSSHAQIAVKVAPLDGNKVYRCTRELVRDFPRYVRLLQDVQYRPDLVIRSGEVIELVRTEKRCVKVRGLVDILICRHFYREVQFPIDATTLLCCSPLVDNTVYMLNDFVRRFPLPRNIIVQNPHLLKITAAARKALCEQQQLPIEFVIHELTAQTFAIGASEERGGGGQPPSIFYIQASQPPTSTACQSATALSWLSDPGDSVHVQFEVLDAEFCEPSVTVEDLNDFPYLDTIRPCLVQVCALDDVLDSALDQPLCRPNLAQSEQNSFTNFARRSVALDFDVVGGQSQSQSAVGEAVPVNSYWELSPQAAMRRSCRVDDGRTGFASRPAFSDSSFVPGSVGRQSVQYTHRREAHGYIGEQNGAIHAARLGKHSSSSSFGDMLKKRVVRLFSASKHNVSAVGGATEAAKNRTAKTGSAPNLNSGFIKASQNKRTVVEIPSPGTSISAVISTPTRSKRSPKVVRRQQAGQRGEMRNSSISLLAQSAKRRTDSLSSLAHNRLNLIELDYDIPNSLLAAQLTTSCVLSSPLNGASSEKQSRRLSTALSSAQLQSVASTPGATPSSPSVWYPNVCMPQQLQLQLYHSQMQSPSVVQKTRSAHEQFEFPPTPKQSTSNGTSLSSGNDDSTRTKQESSVSLASSGSVQLEDLTVQQLGEYLRRHNLERISLLCEQHAVDGPFFLDLTEADLSGYPFCASPFETKCIRRLQKGILPKCD